MDIYKDDSFTIQTLIDRAYESKENKAVIPRINPRTGEDLWEINKTIFLPSDFTLVLDSCHLRMADDVYCNMFCNKHAYDEHCEEQKNITMYATIINAITSTVFISFEIGINGTIYKHMNKNWLRQLHKITVFFGLFILPTINIDNN